MKKRIIISMISSSEYKAIDTKWIGDLNYFNGYIYYIVYGFLIILIISVMLIIWNVTLKSKVKKNTSELRGALEKLRESENKNIAIINAIPDLVLTLNSQGIIINCLSKSTNPNINILKKNFVNTFVELIFPPKISAKFLNCIRKLEDTKEMQIVEFTLEDNNNTKSFEARFIAIERNVILTIIRDITERKRSEKKIYEMSMNDAMTGLNNRFFFEKQIKKWKAKGFINVGIVVCDLDGLKLVNDTFGHNEGDNIYKKQLELYVEALKKKIL